MSITSNFTIDRKAPANTEAEQGLIGTLLYDNRVRDRISGLLAEHFYDPVHARIYEAACRLIDRGGLADPVTLKGMFEDDAALSDVGGARYLADLCGSVVSVLNAAHYAEVIQDCAMRRRLIDLGTEMVAQAQVDDPGTKPADIIGRAETELFRLAETGTSAKPRRMHEFIDEHVRDIVAAQDAPGGVVGIPTGLVDLDGVLRGMRGPDLIVVAGRPGMGKSAYLLNVMTHAASKGFKPLIVSEEMSGKQLAARLIADETGIPVMEQLGRLEPGQMREIRAAAGNLRNMEQWVEETPNLSISAVRAIARRHKRKHGLDLLGVDYLQLLKATGGNARPENRVQEITAISNGLKAIAKELDIPVIALSQLSRAVELREDKRPNLSDLRESGSIEQDADIVIFPFREEYYIAKERPVPKTGENKVVFAERMDEWTAKMQQVAGTADIIVAKFRQGRPDTVRVAFDGARMRFSDLHRGGW